MAHPQLSILAEGLPGIPDDMPIEQARAAVEAACRKNPAAALALALLFLNDKRRLQTLAEERGRQLEQITAAPWTPARLLAHIREGWAMVKVGVREFGVAVSPNVDPAALTLGCRVLLSRELTVIVELGPQTPAAGSVGRFSRFHGAQAVIRDPADEEVVLHLPEDLRNSGLTNGDLLLYDRDSLMALERVETRHEHAGLLEELRSDLRIRHLGALDEVYQSIVEDVLMCFLHRDLAARHGLEPARSIMLIGPPGVGKTSLVKCLANELAEVAGVRVRACLFRPSIHRGKFYGESEERIRAMGEEARRIAGDGGCFLLVLFDDIDQIGSRDTANDIDARVLPAFLHEVEALRSVERIVLVAATNRPDLVDPALTRAGRFGDREYRIPRPGTAEASREILSRYLDDTAPCRNAGGPVPAAAVVEEAVNAMYGPRGELRTLAKLYLRDGSFKPLTPSMLVSGSLLKIGVQTAKQRSCRRALRGGPEGVTAADLIGSLAKEFSNLTLRMRPGPSLHALLELPVDFDVVRVEAHGGAAPSREFVRPPAGEAVA